jgi:peroxiredoxin
MGHIRDKYPELEKRGVGAATILAQNALKIRDYLEDHHYPFPVLADAGREVVKEYGVYVKANFESVNIARPANFILSADGTVRYIHIASIQTEYPKDAEIFAVLDGLAGERD